MKAIRPTLLIVGALFLLVLGVGCSGRDPASLEVGRAPIDPLVYGDDFNDVYFQAFLNTHVTAVSQDSVYAFGGSAVDGARSIKITVPPAGSSLGAYSGGVLTATGDRDLADFNALTFYARAASDMSMGVAGYGNDNTGTSRYEAGRANIPLTSEWSFVIIPIPAPSKMVSERGMFTFAEAPDPALPDGHDIWVDEIRFAKLGNILNPRPIMPSSIKQYFVGATATIDGTFTVYEVDGGFVRVDHSAAYFDYETSDPSVATVTGSTVKIVGVGDATITASLEGVAANGTVLLSGSPPPAGPAAPPTLPAGDVISMFSDVYPDVLVDSWRADWGGSSTQVADYAVDGDNTKMYTTLNFVGILFQTRMIDASAMTHFHLDTYAPSGTDFKVKLVSFPPEGTAGIETPDLVLDADSVPAFVSGGWASLDIPLEAFAAPEGFDWGHIGQLVLSTSDSRLVLVDNIYWHK